MRLFLILLAGLCLPGAQPIRFRITLNSSVAPQGASGRLFVFLDKGSEPVDRIKVGFLPESVWMAAKEVPFWRAGDTVELNPDEMAFPQAFSKAAKGDYVVMALLDRDHTFARERQDAGDLVSAVKVLKALDPADAGLVALELSAVTPERAATQDTEQVKYVRFESPRLSAFFGRPIHMQAGVVVPKGHTAEGPALPTVYHIHGFGGNYREAFAKGERIVDSIASGESFRAVHVFLDGNCPGGHHVFADSVNNGPWGSALTEELVPYLEKRFHLAPMPAGRFVTGHSSGGWTSLWLQVRYPDFFGGTWSTSPDSMDFRNFTGIDVTPGSTQNAFRTKAGAPLNLVRMNGKDIMSVEDFSRLASFDWVFSPRGEDGKPMPLFSKETGELNQAVLKHWQKYEIARIVRDNWAELGPKLRGKIRLTIGSADNFHLNEAAELFCGWLREKGREEACEIVPDRDHFDLHRPYKTYPNGLTKRMDDEMRAQWEKRNQPR